MATKYDCFEILYKNKSELNPKEISKHFPKENYATIYKQLLELEKEKLIKKKNRSFEVILSKKTEILYSIIEHCLKNQINYNSILDKNFAEFVKNSLEKKEINSENSHINPKTLRKYIDILVKNELALIILEKPIKAKIFYNPLVNNLLLFFSFDNLKLNTEKISYIKEIEKNLTTLKSLRKQNETKYKQLVKEIEIPFVYHSLSIEGNPATLLDTQKILKNEILPADLMSIHAEEIKNYSTAIRKMLADAEENKALSIPLILEYHKITMKHKESLSGQIRTLPVHISGNPEFEVSPHKNIIENLENLLKEYSIFIGRKQTSVESIISFAISFHNSFQHIHPFEDGNSRTTRLITFFILQQKGIPIMDIPYGLLDEYISNTKGSKKRDDEKLKETFHKIILFNLIKFIKLLK